MFPELFGSILEAPVTRRAMDKGLASVDIVDIREYAAGSYRHLDDNTFGGGAGCVLRCQPVLDALEACRCAENKALTTDLCAQDHAPADGRCEESNKAAEHVVALTPAGIPYTQSKAHEYAALDHLILLCGHYEGFDARILKKVDEEISIGDYVLTGGELAACVIADSVIRLLKGALREASTAEESFENGLLEYPQYTQPADYKGDKVPEVLLSGNHEKIRRWRLRESLRLTMERRPDLLEKHELTQEEKELIQEIKEAKRRQI